MLASKATTYAGFFVNKLTNYLALEDAYVYLKLAKKLGLNILVEQIDTSAVPLLDKNLGISIALFGDKENIDKFNNIWDKLDNNEVRKELDDFLSIKFESHFNEEETERLHDDINVQNNTIPQESKQSR